MNQSLKSTNQPYNNESLIEINQSIIDNNKTIIEINQSIIDNNESIIQIF